MSTIQLFLLMIVILGAPHCSEKVATALASYGAVFLFIAGLANLWLQTG